MADSGIFRRDRREARSVGGVVVALAVLGVLGGGWAVLVAVIAVLVLAVWWSWPCGECSERLAATHAGGSAPAAGGRIVRPAAALGIGSGSGGQLVDRQEDAA